MNDVIDNEAVDNAPSSAKDAIRQSRELVSVTSTGVQIHDLAQQVDYAQTMAKAKAAIPKFLQENVGDCLAIIDISSRAGLSPYMVAQHCYVQNNRLCFESQLFHAFLQASHLLKGDLEVEYEGEGGEMVCVVTGHLRADPTKARVHRSPPLKERHPGFVLKKAYDDGSTAKKYLSYLDGEKLRQEGKIEEGMKLFSQGSPLWVTKPLVQFFYDTSRDWTRMFAPRATLGIYTPDEIAEFNPEMARDVTPVGSGLSERLRSNAVDKTEGHKDGQAATEMGKAKNGEAAAPKTRAKNKKSAEKQTEAAAPKKEDIKTAAQWKQYCLAWIKAESSFEAIRQRWNDERQLRNNCGVTSDERDPVQTQMVERCKELGEPAA